MTWRFEVACATIFEVSSSPAASMSREHEP
jgi:hypothetical protein